MKYSLIVILLLSVFTYGFTLAKQQNKKQVKLESIDRKYEGKLKKGFAHGKGKAFGDEDTYEGNFKKGYPHGEGIYQWGNGNKYIGNFSKGEMNGKGELSIKREANLPDSILTGYFDSNEYIGKYKDPYKATFSSGIRNVDFQKVEGGNNQVKFMFFANGQVIKPALSIQDVKNTLVRNIGGYDTMVNVDFPLENIKISFSNEPFNFSFDFSIFQKGSWVITVSI